VAVASLNCFYIYSMWFLYPLLPLFVLHL
jgi:hypothetical protein